MTQIDYKKYKPYLKQVVNHFGFNADINPTKCINPEHDNENTPAMMLYDEHFKCANCEASGDIYDAIELLTGISDKFEQYKKVEEILGKSDFNGYNNNTNKKVFTPDKQAVNKLEKYVIKQSKNHQEEIKEYLTDRNSTQKMIDYTSKGVGYWPGYEQAEKDIGKDVLFKSGIPGKNPKTGLYSWGPSGPVVKLSVGFKLFFFSDNGKSQKMGSKKCKIFPAFCKGKSEDLYLTEGEISALSMMSEGFNDVSPTGGVKGLNKDNMESLLPYKRIFIVFDGDPAGWKNQHKLKQSMREFGVDADIYIVRLPIDNDPDDLIKTGKVNEIHEAIKKSIVAESEIIEAKKQAGEKKNDPATPFYFAGYDEKNYYVVPKNQSIPIALGRSDGAIKGLMFDIAAREFWFERFIKESDNGKIVFDVNQAIEWFREKGQKSGLYDQNNALGIGPHKDGKDIIFNLGDSLYLFNRQKKIEYSEYEGSKFFIRSTLKFDINGEPWNLSECRRLYKEIKKYGFFNNIDFMLVAGWIILSPFASILDRRPHLAIIGQKGCGKTTLVDNIIKPAIGEIGIFVEGETTEAGARQAIGRDCRPAIIDEFEARTMEKKKRVEGILSLARSAFGGSAETIKGTQNQKALIFRTKVMFMFLAVKIDLLNDANKSRIPILDMKNLNRELDTNFDFTGLRRRTFINLNKVLELTNITRKYMKDYNLDNRALDTYSTLIAGFWFMVSDAEFLSDESTKLNNSVIDAIESIVTKIESDESEEVTLLNHIFNHIVRISPDKELTVFEMLIATGEDGESYTYKNRLARIGLRRDDEMKIDGGTYDMLAIVANHQEIRNMLKNTELDNYKDTLLRHPSKIFDDIKPIYMAAEKHKHRCIILDWEKIKELHFYNDDVEDNIPF